MGEYDKIRKKLREYRLIESELRARTEYLNDFKKILINPLPGSERHLRAIYLSIVSHMDSHITALHKRLDVIDYVIGKLDGVERNVIYHRYILGTSWLRLPEYVLYEQRTCQEIEQKALRKILNMNVDWDGDFIVK